jgi:hypothetical protein
VTFTRVTPLGAVDHVYTPCDCPTSEMGIWIVFDQSDQRSRTVRHRRRADYTEIKVSVGVWTQELSVAICLEAERRGILR